MTARSDDRADLDRAELVGTVLQAVTVLGRDLTADREPPFGRRLTRNQVETLFLLAHGAAPVTPTRVAGALGVTAGAVTQLVDGLTDLGLVESGTHPRDARSRVLRLTAAARETVVRFERQAVDRLSPRFDPLDDEQLSTLAAILTAITQPATGPPAGR